MDNGFLELYGELHSRHRERKRALYLQTTLAGVNSGVKATEYHQGGEGQDDDSAENDEDGDGPPDERECGIKPALEIINEDEVS